MLFLNVILKLFDHVKILYQCFIHPVTSMLHTSCNFNFNAYIYIRYILTRVIFTTFHTFYGKKYFIHPKPTMTPRVPFFLFASCITWLLCYKHHMASIFQTSHGFLVCQSVCCWKSVYSLVNQYTPWYVNQYTAENPYTPWYMSISILLKLFLCSIASENVIYAPYFLLSCDISCEM